jgi:hypothetical protein
VLPSLNPVYRSPKMSHTVVPLKQQRYPWASKKKRMSVCIAAICQENGEPRIVLCSDTRLSATGFGSSDGTRKIFALGYGWLILLATEDWSSGIGLKDHLRRQWRTLNKLPYQRRIDELKSTLHAQLSQSRYCSTRTEALICGFTRKLPIIVYLWRASEIRRTVFLHIRKAQSATHWLQI